MRLILALLLMVPMVVGAAELDLDDCDTITVEPTAESPLDLDTCDINDGDEITGILTGLASTYGAVYVRAPSRTLEVVADYTAWTLANFYFLEDESPRNRLLIQHDNNYVSTADYFILWSFTNYSTVVIGGSNLSITFRGNQPGLGNCLMDFPEWKPTTCDNQSGFQNYAVDNGSKPALVDVRANIAFTQDMSIRFRGWQTAGDTINKVQQVNIAGLHYATMGFYVNGGVRRLWMDPDRTIMSDPYNRAHGWDGTIAKTDEGRDIGCRDDRRKQPRGGGASTIAVAELTGGVTFNYGWFTLTQRSIGRIGSAESPFVVRLQDWGSSGPGTGYPAGVMVKRAFEPILMKGDPASDLGEYPTRFIRYERLPPKYGDGLYGLLIADGLCAEGNPTSNNYPSGSLNLVRLEANSSTHVNHGYDVTFSGDWETDFTRAGNRLFWFHYLTSSDSPANRSWQHTMRLASGTVIDDPIELIDTNTITGPGVFANVTTGQVIDPSATVGSLPTTENFLNRIVLLTTDSTVYWCTAYDEGTGLCTWTAGPSAKDNTITDTNVSGVVTTGEYTGTLTIDNVNFTGSTRAIVSIADGSTVVMSDICAPANSTVTGTGTLTYEGEGRSLPFTLTNEQYCNITANPRPDPPGVN